MKKSQIIETLENQLRTNLKDFREHQELKASLEKWNGKKLTKRVQNSLPEGWTYKTDVNGPTATSPTGRTHFICYHREAHNYSSEMIDNRNTPYNQGAVSRIDKLKTLLDNPEQLIKDINKLEKAYHTLKTLLNSNSESLDSFYNPAYYELLDLAGIETSAITEVKYRG